MTARRWWVAAAIMALAAGACTTPAAPAPGPPPIPEPSMPHPSETPLTVMSFNIRHGVGIDGVLDLARIARTIQRSGADLVGLQEVDRHFGARSDFVDQATALAGVLGMDLTFGANVDLDPLRPGDPRRQYGNAILSRTTIRDSQNILLPRSPTSEQRGLLEAVVKVRGVTVAAYSTHLQFDAPAERQAQVDAILEHLAGVGSSVVLLGDLNAAPDTSEVGTLLGKLTDAWAEAGTGDGFTFSTATPRTRIDYVLTSDAVVVRTAAVLESDASDHLPVVAGITLPGGRLGHAPGG